MNTKDKKITGILSIVLVLLMLSGPFYCGYFNEPIPEIPENYYSESGNKKYANYDFAYYDILEAKIDWTYEENIFDCSEMSAYYERAFENRGYNAIIVYGFVDEEEGHAWVAVEATDGWMFFEATTQQFLPGSYYEKYSCGNNMYFVFDDIEEAIAEYPTEFDWWNKV